MVCSHFLTFSLLLDTPAEQQLVHGKIPPDEMLLKNPSTKTPKKFGRNNNKSESESIDFTDNDDADESGRSRTCSSNSGLFDDEPSSPGVVRSPLVAKILEANPVCADCGNTDPE